MELVVRFEEIDPGSVRPGWVALLIVLALAAATFFLWRNMGKQMRKIDFDEDRSTSEPTEQSEPSATAERTDHRPEGNGSKG